MKKLILILGIIIGIVLGVGMAEGYDMFRYRALAIANACAHYNVRTGDFEWNAEATDLDTAEGIQLSIPPGGAMPVPHVAKKKH